ncbi:MAG: bifunctional oligoribonuclease/PAP phosphatase NrnA [Lachnospiraceae bacterium]|nr:bifunctional oligoribonuclease/PAP phosphatase NrnA [Lachnospiraceae bacterium]
MSDLRKLVKDAQNILIAGHLRPDGDCVGACVAAYHYLKDGYPDKCIHVYLETLPARFEFLDENRTIISEEIALEHYDLCIALDSSSSDRLGKAESYFYDAKRTLCIDHHISNEAYAMENVTLPDASSTCEVLYGLMQETISRETAAALYIGIIFDSGGFSYSNTSKKTMEIAGALMETGIPFWEYIDRCFHQRSYIQTQLLGRTLLTSMRLMDGQCIVATITRRMMEFYEAKTEDIEGIIDQLRVTKGVEVAILLHEIGNQEYKVSMRSNSCVDVSRIAAYFSGGGHVRAAGCTMRGSVHDVINNITEHIEAQLKNKITA